MTNSRDTEFSRKIQDKLEDAGMAAWLPLSDKATFHFSICHPSQPSCRILKIVTTLWTANRTPEKSMNFILYDVTDLFIPAEKSFNGNISWLVHQLQKYSAYFTFWQEYIRITSCHNDRHDAVPNKGPATQNAVTGGFNLLSHA